MYAMGTTQHTYGSQNVRAYAVLQLLLGNIGVAGGGINALRGESNVQGSTDHGALFHILTGYLKYPKANQPTLVKYNEDNTPKTKDPKSLNWWGNTPKYMASLMKAWWRDADLETAYSYLPKIDDGKNYSYLPIFSTMANGEIKGLFCLGHEPRCGRPEFQDDQAGPCPARLDGVRRPVGDRDICLLAEGSRCKPGRYQDRGLPASGSLLCGERRLNIQFRQVGAVAIQGHRSASDMPRTTSGSSTRSWDA